MNGREKDEREHLAEAIDRFWSERGRSRIASGEHITMLVSHRQFADYVHGAEVRYLQGLIRRFDSPPRVLDLGCGSGRLTSSLAAHCSEIVGVDVSASLLEIARHDADIAGLTNTKFVEQRASAPLPGSKEAFDLVVVSGLLNYLTGTEVRSCLSWAAQALRRGGLLYVRNNVSNAESFERHTARNPAFVRSGEEYVSLLGVCEGLRPMERRYLFAPICLPNLVYYYALPRRIREQPFVTALLGQWFRWERMTSEWRVRHLSRQYRAIMRALRKPTSFEVLLAVRE